jgi:hypothetical protein
MRERRVIGIGWLVSFVLFGTVVFGLAHYGAQHFGELCPCYPSVIESATRHAVTDVEGTAAIYGVGVAGLVVIVVVANGAAWIARRGSGS